MPSLMKLDRVVRLATLPETRRLIREVRQSETIRDMAQRARDDRQALLRDLRNPANARDLIRTAARHPAARELASASFMLLPARYLPAGWAATWVTRKILGRVADRPADVLDQSRFGPRRLLKNVTPR
jgi:phytoene/squalene synthetase